MQTVPRPSPQIGRTEPVLSARSLGFAAAVALAMLSGSGCSSQPPSDAALAADARIDFNRQIRPILNQNCTACHGGVKAEGGVSFVFKEEALGTGQSGERTIVPGRPDESELVARIESSDEEYRMPLAGHGQPLSADQIALIRRWIAEGAEWSEHWAFVAPQPQTPPSAKDRSWPRGSLDQFVLARLEREGLAPSEPAQKEELLRRVSLDLIGLPPTLEEQDAFLSDTTGQAYEKAVDRLLASPRFGERWATPWLDLARYADTKGYEADRARVIWKYRDWVIDAINENVPYDRFVAEQLAGDLLPEPSLEQLLATAFHRNTQTNDEGGTDDEEFRIAAVQDRVATTWVALNGVSFSCIQCHSHPYDPIRHDEYYKFYAFFNNTRDADLMHEYPTLRVPDERDRYDEARGLKAELESLRRALVAPGKQLAREADQWRSLPIERATAKPEVTFRLEDGEAFAVGTSPLGVEYRLVVEPQPPALTALRIEAPPLDAEAARHTPEFGFVVNRIEATILHPDGTEEPIEFDRFAQDTEDFPSAPFGGAAPRPQAALQLSSIVLGSESVFSASPSLFETRWIVGIPREPLQLAPGARVMVKIIHTPTRVGKMETIRRVRLSGSSDPRWTRLGADHRLAEQEERAVALIRELAEIPGTYVPITRERPADQQRETRLFSRGNWLDKTGEPLSPDVPAIFPPLPAGEPRNRLTLANWFFSPGQPLTARVAVNRFWEQLFGIGLVETLEDFGSVGEPPSHPELLDWLALRFQEELRWDVKALLREIVTSATYRQTARADAALRERDPGNRLLARGPRNRLSAEMVRDQALLAGGLLSDKMHGPSVMPPQPPGIWAYLRRGGEWVDASGEDRFRRAVYTYWKRTSPYPSFLTFDSPQREVCSVRRIPTNTPLQALVTLNDTVYVEAAQGLAERMAALAPEGAAAQISLGFRLAASRSPNPAELNALIGLYRDAGGMYDDEQGEPTGPPFEDREAAARFAVAQALLNLDAVLTK